MRKMKLTSWLHSSLSLFFGFACSEQRTFVWLIYICLVNFLWAITFILSFAWRMFCCQVWSNSISALSQNGVFSLLSVIGCRTKSYDSNSLLSVIGCGTKSYDSNTNWGCHRHPACHLCWPKTPGASSESSRGRGGLEVDASKLICTHYKQQGG